MKIGILTFHDAHNYGAVLQAYALKKYIQSLGHEAKIINYHHKTIPDGFPREGHEERWDKFNKFINELTDFEEEVCTSEEDLEKQDVDAWICGSDQIWNTEITRGFNKGFFLDFETKSKKISYAVSMGIPELPEEHEEHFKRSINKLDVISVREESLKEYAKKFTNKKIEKTLDPTLLLEASDYDNLLLDNKYGDYVLDGGIPSDRKLQYVLVQQYIWEALGQSSATFVDSSIQSQYVELKNTINSQIDNMSKRPSFDATTMEIDAGDTYTATDTNGVLSNYNSIDQTLNGVRFQHNKGENTLIITVSEDCEVENLRVSDATTKGWGLIKEGTEDNDTTVYFEMDDSDSKKNYKECNISFTFNGARPDEEFGGDVGNFEITGGITAYSKANEVYNLFGSPSSADEIFEFSHYNKESSSGEEYEIIHIRRVSKVENGFNAYAFTFWKDGTMRTALCSTDENLYASGTENSGAYRLID